MRKSIKVIGIMIQDQRSRVPASQRFTAILDEGSGGGPIRTGPTAADAVAELKRAFNLPPLPLRYLPVENHDDDDQ